MLLKLCVSETGGVAKVLVLKSSGNADADRYYTTELSKWTYTALETEAKQVRSVAEVTVTLYVK